MDDPFVVRLFERLGDLARDGERLFERQRPLGKALAERRTLDQLEDERPPPTIDFQAVDRRDVRVIEARQDLGLALETGETLGIL